MSVLKKARLPARCMRFFSLTASIFTIVLGLGVMYSSFLWQKDFTDAKIAAGYPTVFMDNIMVHPVKGFTDALSYINTYTPEDAVILSDLTAGNYIPAYTGRRVFVGHDNTVNEERKLTDARAFFDGAMDSQEAQAWMFLTNITHVFFGPQEKKSGKNLSELYPFLRLAYTNSDVTVFTVPSAKTQ